MPDDPESQVSVGIFSEEDRAEDRAARVQRLRLDAVVSERSRELPVIWFDMPGVARETLADGRLAQTGMQLDTTAHRDLSRPPLRLRTYPHPRLTAAPRQL